VQYPAKLTYIAAMKTKIACVKFSLCCAIGGLILSNSAPGLAQSKPVIVQQPQGLIVAPGATALFRIEATGDEPLSYRWRRSFYTLPGQTNATLVVSNVTATDTGYYTVVITNAYGLVVSRNIPLTLFSLSRVPEGIALDLNGYRGGGGNPAAVYELQYVARPGDANWLTLTNLSLPTSPYRFIDTSVTNTAQRYYRAVLLPWW